MFQSRNRIRLLVTVTHLIKIRMSTFSFNTVAQLIHEISSELKHSFPSHNLTIKSLTFDDLYLPPESEVWEVLCNNDHIKCETAKINPLKSLRKGIKKFRKLI